MSLSAVIAAAGVGSRLFPVSRTITKCMLPVLNRPVLDYALADCIAAGAQRIAIVAPPGEGARQIRHYVADDPELRAYFDARGWQNKYKPAATFPGDITVIEQPRTSGSYGTALPLIYAADWVGQEDDVLLVSGDDLLLRDDGGSDLADLVAARTTAGTAGAVAAATVPGTDAHQYGLLQPRTAPGGHLLLAGLLERPADYREPTAYINVSRTLLPVAAIGYFLAVRPAANGELQATDAVAALAADHDILIHSLTGRYLDCGNPAGLLTASLAVARLQGLTGDGWPA
ncbi:NTP transferase domain-containing protein [Kitasatospora aureofaciens]|uniref:sugar phosphate nucleotidyltransferase n=1 Tax=Kitasatospora aureofaciens TaxID=1894 RepID=UPI001C48AD0B|nr:sugar phosphate nucleotidyltransferase [Kitasatospora aureofaciens]MBV6702756.1 NTP transferase domain-containing protein [Kitasatospora aureofaciens]